jgi:ElaB/YqjD/DUF883 family membrane-anchored ribosome-binding protein
MTSNPAPNQAVADNLKQIKAEGSRRSKTIGKIFRAALAEAVTELKAGTTTIRPLAKTLAGNTVHAVKDKSQELNANVRQILRETAVDEPDKLTRLKLQLQAILKVVRATLFTRAPMNSPESVPHIQTDSVSAQDTVVTLEVVAKAQ